MACRVVNCFQNRIFALSLTTSNWNLSKAISCELLSESYLCIIAHNESSGDELDDVVVNCFQNRIFALSLTTYEECSSFRKSLWIAFRIVSLHYRSQRPSNRDIIETVVNCFQNRIFALSLTTRRRREECVWKLWIAFRIVSLHYRSQRSGLWSGLWLRCELLSESYLCIIAHNTRK